MMRLQAPNVHGPCGSDDVSSSEWAASIHKTRLFGDDKKVARALFVDLGRGNGSREALFEHAALAVAAPSKPGTTGMEGRPGKAVQAALAGWRFCGGTRTLFMQVVVWEGQAALPSTGVEAQQPWAAVFGGKRRGPHRAAGSSDGESDGAHSSTEEDEESEACGSDGGGDLEVDAPWAASGSGGSSSSSNSSADGSSGREFTDETSDEGPSTYTGTQPKPCALSQPATGHRPHKHSTEQGRKKGGGTGQMGDRRPRGGVTGAPGNLWMTPEIFRRLFPGAEAPLPVQLRYEVRVALEDEDL